MRYLTSVILSVITFFLIQETNLENYQRQFQQAEGNEEIIAFRDYILALARQDLYQADSVIEAFTNSYQGDKKTLEWGRLYFTIADIQYFLRNYEKSHMYLDSAKAQFQRIPATNETDFADLYELRGLIFQRHKVHDSSAYYFNIALEHAQKGESREVLGTILNTIATNYYYQGDYAEALNYYNRSLQIRKELPDTSIISINYRNIGLTYKVIGDYSSALEYYEMALPIYESQGDPKGLATIYNSIGVLYKELGNYEEAVNFHLRSMENRKLINDTVGWAYSLDNIGSAYIEKGDFGMALEHLLPSEKLKSGVDGDVSMYNTLSNIGICLDKLSREQEAINYFKRALELAKKYNEKRAIVLVYNNLNLLYRDEGKYSIALENALKSLEASTEIGTMEALATSHLYLSDTYKALGEYAHALEQRELYEQYQSKIFDEKAASEKNRILINYDFEQQRKALKESEAKLQNVSKEHELLRARQVALWVAVGCLVLVIFFGVFLFVSRLKKANLEKHLAETNVKVAELNRENLGKELQIKDMKLTSYATQLSQQNELIASFEKQLTSGQNNDLGAYASKVDGRGISQISWEEFRLKFDQVHPGFVNELSQKHQDLTSNEMDISVLLKINLSNKEIASILGVSYESVKKSIQRLYRKIDCANADELRSHLFNI